MTTHDTTVPQVSDLPTRADTTRQWVVLTSTVVATLVAFLASGAVVGTAVQDLAGGALSSTATLVAPATPAFSIWGVIYTGLLLLAVLQMTPARATDPRQRRIGWWVAASTLLNAAWLVVTQLEWLAVSVGVIAVLLVVLVLILVRLRESGPTTTYERYVVDGTMGLYLGWVCIAAVANVAATLVYSGWAATGDAAILWAVGVLAVAGVVGILLAVTLRGRATPAVALAWGLAWVAFARTSGEPSSAEVAVAAAGAALVTLLSAVVVRARRTP
jgi:hypothetical protein